MAKKKKKLRKQREQSWGSARISRRRMANDFIEMMRPPKKGGVFQKYAERVHAAATRKPKRRKRKSPITSRDGVPNTKGLAKRIVHDRRE